MKWNRRRLSGKTGKEGIILGRREEIAVDKRRKRKYRRLSRYEKKAKKAAKKQAAREAKVRKKVEKKRETQVCAATEKRIR